MSKVNDQSVPQPGLEPELTLMPWPAFLSFLFFLLPFFTNLTFCPLKAPQEMLTCPGIARVVEQRGREKAQGEVFP